MRTLPYRRIYLFILLSFFALSSIAIVYRYVVLEDFEYFLPEPEIADESLTEEL